LRRLGLRHRRPPALPELENHRGRAPPWGRQRPAVAGARAASVYMTRGPN
jgi:hypothetical protein